MKYNTRRDCNWISFDAEETELEELMEYLDTTDLAQRINALVYFVTDTPYASMKLTSGKDMWITRYVFFSAMGGMKLGLSATADSVSDVYSILLAKVIMWHWVTGTVMHPKLVELQADFEVGSGSEELPPKTASQMTIVKPLDSYYQND